MYPILFEWGPLRIGSYGLLLAMGFGAAIFVVNREYRRNDTDLNLAWDIYLLAIFGGLVGSRTLFILENWQTFLKSPARILFSPTGFSVIGGFVLAIFLCAIRVRAARQPFRKIADLTAPGMAIGYAVGRLGCITSGDGCYGIPTTGWFGMTFPHGLVPTLSAKNTMLAVLWAKLYPHLPTPGDIPVHPTPLYEAISQFLLCGVLLALSWNIGRGRRFGFFLCWFGLSRFLVEFIRLNPILPIGLTSDQVLSIVSFGLGLWFMLGPVPTSEPAIASMPAPPSAVPHSPRSDAAPAPGAGPDIPPPGTDRP
jgi:phosphatidylglycerol:prolipoprotein diacylglycerol transferase